MNSTQRTEFVFILQTSMGAINMNHQKLPCQELIYCLHQKIKSCFFAYSNHSLKKNGLFEEQYKIEREIFTWMVREILETGEYTLDGIAHHTRLPLEVISDAAMGMQRDVSMTLWMKIADVFLQLKNKAC